jgi:hypothetical protein
MINIDKFVAIKNALKAQHGEFTLFGVFLRDDAPDKWDVLVAAPWAETDKAAALKAISLAVTSTLTSPELLLLSRVVILEHDNPVLRAIWGAMKLTNSVGHFVDCTLNGLHIRHAYILESQPPPHPQDAI